VRVEYFSYSVNGLWSDVKERRGEKLSSNAERSNVLIRSVLVSVSVSVCPRIRDPILFQDPKPGLTMNIQ